MLTSDTHPLHLIPAQAETARRERVLLIIALVFVMLGTVILHLALRLAPGHALIIMGAFGLSFASAHVALNHLIPNRDPFLLPVATLLTGWGLLLIGRLAVNFLLRQAIWLLISTIVLITIVRLSHDLRWLRRFRYTWLFGGLALLAATLVFGVNPSGYGPRLWLGVLGIYFQPAELLKLLLIAFLASYLAERRELLIVERWQVGRWRLPPLAYVGPLLAMFGLAVVLLGWQQDLGAAMLFFFTFLAMLYLATAQWGYVVAGLALFLVAGIAGYALSDKVALRVDGWLNPWPEAADRAFQIVQSLLAFGAGGIAGQGLGLGNPSYIPAVHTDFVFAAAGEEFGLLGTLAIVALYGVLLLRGFRIAARTRRPFERFLAAGLSAGLVIQAWVIMAGNARLAPIAGVTLPWVSYGGSSLLISFISLGLLLRISESAANQPANRQTNPPTNRPLLRLACALSLALTLLAATCGYWTVARAGALRTREDNPRRVLYEQRIVRGRILDRNGAILADAEATENVVTRRYLLPQAAPVLGYASLRHGTGGIESTFDAELRGEAGRTTWQAAWDELLHRPPRGYDVQLTLDAALQALAQAALTDHAGAIVLLDSTTGEILAMASSPTFDPQHLDEMWESLREDPVAPLVNRATQGLYQPGAALQTVILAEALSQGIAVLTATVPNATGIIAVNGAQQRCSEPLDQPYTLAGAYAAACPVPFADLGEQLGDSGLIEAITRWGLTITPPPLEIPTEAVDWTGESLTDAATWRAEGTGQGSLTVSPLQMALVAGTLANDGTMPAARLVLRIQDADGRWQEQASAGEPRTILTPAQTQELLAAWHRYDSDVAAHWGTAIAGEKQAPHVWFLGVSPAAAPRYAVAVLIERAASPKSVVGIGAALLEAAAGK